jgi:SpoU rRNA methylase family enzyme
MKGNAIKYILRAGKKDLLVQDLKKAIECLNREIEYEGGK